MRLEHSLQGRRSVADAHSHRTMGRHHNLRGRLRRDSCRPLLRDPAEKSAEKSAKNAAFFREKIEIRAAAAYELLLAMFSRGYMDQVLFAPWFSWFLGFDSKTVQRSALCRSRRELSNEYLLAKFGFDTAENEP